MSDFIMINNVRVSFPHLFKKPIINGEEGKCGATLMLDPEAHSKSIAVINKQIEALFKEKFKGRKLPAEKLCLRDGEDKGRTEYEGFQILSANSKGKPLVISTNGKDTVNDEDDCPIYAGCYVNAKVRLWAQDNSYGKRVNCELVAIQFAADGETLDGTHVSVDEAMDGFGGVTEDDDDFLAA
ncbi:phage-like protein [gamma proteobacterium IMCC1989]|nr:phage-like protein [gamma proteobacterium IMCC1989]